MRPWLERIDQSMDRDFLSYEERLTHFFRFDTTEMERGDLQSQVSALVAATGRPIMKLNEARQRMNWEPVDGGDTVVMPLNMSEGGEHDGAGMEGNPQPEE
jgi:hypothetical protein